MKTAVEWFKSEFEKYYAFSTEEMETFVRMFNQAKQMEKEQIEKAYEERRVILPPDENCVIRLMSGEQYYNETFKNTNDEA